MSNITPPLVNNIPDCTGKTADDAVAEIKNKNPHLNVIKVSKDDLIESLFISTRVVVWYDPETSLVSGTPRIG